MRATAKIVGLLLTTLALGCDTTAAAEIGQSCKEKEDCVSGLCLQEIRFDQPTGWPGGYCTAECESSCSDNASCVALGDESYCMANCETHEDCRSGYLCEPWLEVCLPDCRTSKVGCGEEMVCSFAGYCLPQGSSEVGKECNQNDECKGGICIKDSKKNSDEDNSDEDISGWEDGYCTEPCAIACEDDNAECVPFGLEGYCMARCTEDEECRTGYVCNPYVGACLPNCNNWDCGSEMYECDEDTGYCELVQTTFIRGDALLGEPCERYTDCNDPESFCFQESNGWTDGYCSTTCTGVCDEGTECVPFEKGAYCMTHCEIDDDCRDGYVCSPDDSACLPRCPNWDCGNFFDCDAQSGLCVPKTLGSPCELDAECSPGFCIVMEQTSKGIAWTDGMCASGCEACPTAFECTEVGAKAICLPGCETSSNCRSGYVCSDDGACIPDCNLGFACPSDSTCNGQGLCTESAGFGVGGI